MVGELLHIKTPLPPHPDWDVTLLQRLYLLSLIPCKEFVCARAMATPPPVLVDVPQNVRTALFRWAEQQEQHVTVFGAFQDYFNSNGKYLNLDDCGLLSLPPEIWQLTALSSFWCSRNRLSSFPAEIGQLKALTELVCSNNQLSSLPAEIGQLEKLTTFHCSYNQLTSLPAEIGQLTALTDFYCFKNQLSSLPAEIGQLTALALLSCTHNQLSSLPTELGQLTALTSLKCTDNPFPEGAPQTLTELRAEDRSGRRTKPAPIR